VAAALSSCLLAGCHPPPVNLLGVGLGYLLGRWEATRVEVVITERTCYQDGVQIPCP
jgi:hypothetical protein